MSNAGPCIELNQVRFQWPSSQSTLLSIDHLTINQGERVFIQGASGSGKSTLLNLLTGVLPATSGSISVLGESIGANHHAKIDQFRADHFGIIFQQFNLIPYLSVLENILLPLSFSKYKQQRLFGENVQQHALRLLDALGLSAESIAHRNITELSIGQQQRAAAARALIGSPEIIIADEPTSALDHDAKQNFLELLSDESNKSRSTLIFVSHDHSLAGMFERKISINELKSVANNV